jgi:hypothetical protein
MSRVVCEVTFGKTKNDHGVEVDCTTVECSECGHKTTSYGTGERSVRRCLALMAEQCPEGEDNFYVSEDEDGGQHEVDRVWTRQHH